MSFSEYLKKLLNHTALEPAEEKKSIRTKIKHLKSQISEPQKLVESVKVFDKIESQPEFITAKTILVYWSMPDELPTHNFIIKWSKEKKIYLPVVKGDNMYIKPFSSTKNLVKGNYGIWEPDSQKEFEEEIDLVIVPGVAFDRNKTRLGRGKGYYDRYFTNGNVIKWGVCFDVQLVDHIPAEDFDVRMDKVFSHSFIVD